MYSELLAVTPIAQANWRFNSSQDRRCQRNIERAMLLEEAMFNNRSRYLLLVLTLGYKEHCRSLVTLETLRQHRDHLLNNRRCNKLLQDIEAYAWKIEQGENAGGLHLHAVIFYAGSHRADILIAKSIGDYWVDVITQGMGAYWNSNAQKELHAIYGHGVGTGQINRNDDAKREALRKNLAYLAKGDQRVTEVNNGNERFFGTSQFPRS